MEDRPHRSHRGQNQLVNVKETQFSEITCTDLKLWNHLWMSFCQAGKFDSSQHAVMLLGCEDKSWVWHHSDRPGCSEILKIVLKFFADVLKFLNTPGHAFDTQAFMSDSGSGHLCPCEPQTQLWTLKTEGHACTVMLLKVQNKPSTCITGFG